LLNALLNEERAIVSDIAGTTRDTIEDEIHLGGVTFRFIDTAGLRHTTDKVESIGIKKAHEKIDQARVVIYLFDAANPPKELTQNFIEQHEGFDRSYFSGYLGPINVQDETNIFVNLRCAKLEDDNAQLFAGAGIIANSNPAKEWKETELKMDTILSVINEM